MSNKTYNTLKTTALLLVPVLAFIAALVNIWDVPHADQIVASLTALDTLVGAIVVAAGKAYKGKAEQLEEEPSAAVKPEGAEEPSEEEPGDQSDSTD